jgi:dihydroflavonol-4-reductase
VKDGKDGRNQNCVFFASRNFFKYTLISVESQSGSHGSNIIATVLLTGGTGFIGSHTVEFLIQQGHHVRCTIRPGRRTLGWLAKLPVELIESDLRDHNSLASHVKDVEYIFHIAGVTKAKKKQDFFVGNVETTEALLHATQSATTLKKFCLISSLVTTGPSRNGQPLDESAPFAPITIYGQSKVEAELLVQAYSQKLPIVILRPPAVYGPRDRDILEIFQWVKRGIIPLIGPSKKTLSLIHANDLARGIVEATFSPATVGKTYFLSEAHPHEYMDLAETVARLLGKRTRKLRIPTPLFYSLAAVSQIFGHFQSSPPPLNLDKVHDLLQAHWICSPSRIKQDIGFQTEIPTVEGLRSTLDWYVKQGWL